MYESNPKYSLCQLLERNIADEAEAREGYFKILDCFEISIVPKKSYVDIKAERLIKGSKGDAVTALQTLLVASGYGTFKPDGSFGVLTEKAVIEFQKKNGTGVDGIVGAKTWSKLIGD